MKNTHQQSIIEKFKVRIEPSHLKNFKYSLVLTIPDDEGLLFKNFRLHFTEEEYEEFKGIVNEGLKK
jgi:hypothetical protein